MCEYIRFRGILHGHWSPVRTHMRTNNVAMFQCVCKGQHEHTYEQVIRHKSILFNADNKKITYNLVPYALSSILSRCLSLSLSHFISLGCRRLCNLSKPVLLRHLFLTGWKSAIINETFIPEPLSKQIQNLGQFKFISILWPQIYYIEWSGVHVHVHMLQLGVEWAQKVKT